MKQQLLLEIPRSLPCVVYTTSSNVALNERFVPCSQLCVSVIANDCSKSLLISNKPVCRYQLMKLRLVVLFLNEKGGKTNLDFTLKRE